jgi:hypothetical protein
VSTLKPAWTSAGGKSQIALSDCAKREALISSACRSSGDISGSKLRTAPRRATTLGSDSVAPNLSWSLPIGMRRAHRGRRFRQCARNDADTELARVIALDDIDVRVTHTVFDLPAHAIELFPALLD